MIWTIFVYGIFFEDMGGLLNPTVFGQTGGLSIPVSCLLDCTRVNGTGNQAPG